MSYRKLMGIISVKTVRSVKTPTIKIILEGQRDSNNDVITAMTSLLPPSPKNIGWSADHPLLPPWFWCYSVMCAMHTLPIFPLPTICLIKLTWGIKFMAFCLYFKVLSNRTHWLSPYILWRCCNFYFQLSNRTSLGLIWIPIIMNSGVEAEEQKELQRFLSISF